MEPAIDNLEKISRTRDLSKSLTKNIKGSTGG